MAQAHSATNAAKSLLAKTSETQQNNTNEVQDKEITELKKTIEDLKEQLALESEDKKVLKKQADNLAKEYDRLAEENIKLQKKVTIGAGDNKKDE